jgi:hypothetical protein
LVQNFVEITQGSITSEPFDEEIETSITIRRVRSGLLTLAPKLSTRWIRPMSYIHYYAKLAAVPTGILIGILEGFKKNFTINCHFMIVTVDDVSSHNMARASLNKSKFLVLLQSKI